MTTTEGQTTDTAAKAEKALVEVRNPADGSVVGTVPDQSADEVRLLADELRAAQPAWEALGPKARARHLRQWLDWIVDNQHHIFGLVHREAGKSWGDAQIELLVCMEVINYYTKHGADFLADETRTPHGPASLTKAMRIKYRPYQLVGVITPWNYPLGMPFMDVPGALMAGAAVLSKPSEETPLAWAECVRGWNEEIGAPKVLGCATGRGGTGSAVVDAVDMVQFTGSTATGRRIGVRCAERLIPASLELGGKDAMIVLSDAPLERTIRGAIWGGLFNSGQSCIAVERVYVEEPVYDEFVSGLVEAVNKVRQGHDPQGSFSTEVGAMATQSQLELVERQVADAVAKGARVLTGGKRADKGLFYPPTILVEVDHTMSCMRDETFGPLLPIMKVGDENEAVTLANDSHYGLGASVWTLSKERAERVGARLETGAVNVNNAMTNVFQFPLPMGGWKESGLGHRFGGPNGIRKYCRQQAFVNERVNLSNETHWYPYSPMKSRFTATVLRLIELHDWRRRLGLKPR
ncbi:aldehyde dehydrogenase [Mycobacterium antarcticum]|uniref:aldehyde dehydrogenase family protein n=1 Tax=unclassified Mycolicibacterium TaxID=2636767 RepID=UPI0023887D81|nr:MULTISPECIES: aldehyde dehydrogenase family protein [unclassified Mycolicibacterium]BDX33437.1 aldehyde dehydrogenase [Mycolicibacterium sp. TUM20985]GLP82949.1 aldehyde dehydrogenase [Mycolicibacterium sp. TUM20984]